MPSNTKRKRKRGRPTKYRAEYCEMLVTHMKEGFSFDSFCALVDEGKGCDRDSLYEWVHVHPNFSDAKRRGEQLALLYWENVLKQGVSGKLMTEVTKVKQAVDANGKPIGDRTVEKQTVPASFAASPWIFMMKNRYGWRDKRETELTGKDGGPIQQAQLSQSELVAALKSAKQEDDLEDGFDP